MPHLKDQLAKAEALADAPTLGNLHPDARTQAIARASRADAEAMSKRLTWLHGPASQDVNGYEWGVFRVKWKNGQAVEVLQTSADFSDLDTAMAAFASPTTPTEGPAQTLTDEQILEIAHDAGLRWPDDEPTGAQDDITIAIGRAIESKVRASTLTDPEGAS